MSFPPHLCSVVIVSSCLLRYPVLVPSSSHPPPAPLPFPPAPSSSSSSPPASCASFLPPVSVPVSIVFSCCFLSLPSPFLRLAGRGVLCLLVSSSLRLSLSHLVSLAFACLPPLIVFDRSPRHVLISCRRSSRPSSCSCLIVPSVRSFVLPVFRQVWAGSMAARSRCACPCSRRAGGGRCRLDSVGGEASAGMVCCLAGLLVGGLCSVCGVGVCIYKLGACSCMMIVVERKRLRRDFRR